MGIPDKHRAYQALRGTQHALRDRLTVEEAPQLAAQLPLLIMGIYYQGWGPTDKPHRIRTREEFLDYIANAWQGSPPLNPENAARAVFTVLGRRISEGEIEDITGMLPQSIRELWSSDKR